MNDSLSFEDAIDASLDLTPLIDAVFMLLIFFIMATTFSKPVLEVALAKAESASVKETVKEKLTVTITTDGRILFDDTPVQAGELAARLAPLAEDTPLLFNVDKGAPFGLFVQVIDAAKSRGMVNFVINTTAPERSPEETRHDRADANQ